MSNRSLVYLLALTTPAIVAVSLLSSGYWTYLALIEAFVLIPFLELFFSGSTKNMSKEEEKAEKNKWLYDYLLYAIVPIQLGLMAIFLYRIGYTEVSSLEHTGLIIAFGLACGTFGINVAHELGHRHTAYEKVMAKILLLTSLYMHFIIEHNRGHHKHVSTEKDPASAERGEMLYAFWIRSSIMSYRSAWKLEGERLSKLGKSFWSVHNEMVRFTIFQLALLAGIYFIFGFTATWSFTIAAGIGILLLETVNYIEHYGLRRKKIDENRYERTLPAHSWNANHSVGRIVLFELTRHSDHHYHAGRKYQTLRHFDESPQMPTGYPGMMLISLIPPLWFMIMHKRIDDFRANNPAGELLA